jgi:hypothetical protein
MVWQQPPVNEAVFQVSLKQICLPREQDSPGPPRIRFAGAKRAQGATTRSADRSVKQRGPISGVGRCTLVGPLSLPAVQQKYPREPSTRLGSRTDKSPTAKLPLEWPTQ